MASAARKRLVIFGCGYVGAAVALEGLARDLHVIALTRNAATAHALRAQGVETVVADLAGDAWHHAIDGAPELVVNCVSSGGGGMAGYRRSYVDGMQSIASWARQHGAAGTLVYTGSTSVYPQGGGVVVDEDADTSGTAERGQLLREAEAILRGGEGICRRWFILRMAGIYGPGRHHLLEQVEAGEVGGAGEHRLNLIHRDDIVRAIWACFEAPAAVANEIFNLADDAPTPKQEVAEWLAKRLGRPAPRFTGEPAAGRRAVTPDRVISNAKIKARLGWRPLFRDFRAGYESLLSD